MAMPPHFCSLIRGGTKPVPRNGIGSPLSIGLRFALVPTIAIGGFAAGMLLITARVVRSMGAMIRRGLVFCRRWLIAVVVGRPVMVAEGGGKVGAMCNRVTLRGTGNSQFLRLVEGTGRRVSGTERER